MAELPFLPLAIDAYLADCGHLDDAEHGRYLLILMELWRAPHQRLPNDDAWLSRRFRRSVERVQAELRPLITEFCLCDGNWITQKRLSKEFSRARKVTKQRSDAAKSLWRKKKAGSERISEDGTPRIAPAYEPTPTPTPTPTEEHSPSESAATPAPAPSSSTDEAGSPDVKAAIFGAGLQWFMRNTGSPEPSCRSFLGQLIAQHGEAKTASVLMAAERARPVDPRGWMKRNIEGALNGPRPRNDPQRRGGTSTRAAYLAHFGGLGPQGPDRPQDGDDEPELVGSATLVDPERST